MKVSRSATWYTKKARDTIPGADAERQKVADVPGRRYRDETGEIQPAEHMQLAEKDTAERVANFSDPDARTEVLLEKFLHQMDEDLSLMLKAYPLPVFVMVPNGCWVISKTDKAPARYHLVCGGNYEELPVPHIFEVLQPRDQLAACKATRPAQPGGKSHECA